MMEVGSRVGGMKGQWGGLTKRVGGLKSHMEMDYFESQLKK